MFITKFIGGNSIFQVKNIKLPYGKIYDYVKESNSKDHIINHQLNILEKLRDLNSCYIDYPYLGKQSHQGLQIDINIYKEKDGNISFPDDKTVNYLTYNDIYPLKRVPFEDFSVSIMNNAGKYLDNKYGKKWSIILPKEERFPHEGKMDSSKTCLFHYEKYPNLYNNNSSSNNS